MARADAIAAHFGGLTGLTQWMDKFRAAACDPTVSVDELLRIHAEGLQVALRLKTSAEALGFIERPEMQNALKHSGDPTSIARW